jgi:hypothetical protein
MGRFKCCFGDLLQALMSRGAGTGVEGCLFSLFLLLGLMLGAGLATVRCDIELVRRSAEESSRGVCLETRPGEHVRGTLTHRASFFRQVS